MATTGALFNYVSGVGRVVSVKNYANAPYTLGNVTIVDGVNGSDTTGTVGGLPYKTVQAALTAITTASATGQTVWIQPGTYTLTTNLTLPGTTVIKGSSSQNTIITRSTTTTATMITMAENCRIEDVTITLTGTGSTDNLVLKGVVFPGTSSTTSSIRNSTINVNNSGMGSTLTSTVTGVEFSGTGSLSSAMATYNSLKGVNVNLASNGKGNKRGVLVSGSNQASTRETNIYVSAPTNTTSTGSYVGVETNDSNNVGMIQLRTTMVSAVPPTGTQAYTASDILQTSPATFTNPTYLASSGIQVGAGTGLVTKTAGSKGFSTYLYPNIIYYGVTGNIKSGPSAGYLSPGTQAASGSYPITSTPVPYFQIQQPCLLAGMYMSLTTAPGGSNSITVTVKNGSTSTDYTLTITGTSTQASMYNKSVHFSPGDQVIVYVTYTGTTANNSANLTLQLDLF